MNLVTADARGQLGGGIKEGRGQRAEIRGRRSEVIRLRPTGYAATRRTTGSSAQLSLSFASYAFGVIKSIRFAVICCKRYKIAARKPLPQEMEDGSESRWQKAVSLSVMSYSLFGRSVAMSCLDDLNGFYDLTNQLIF